MSIKISTGFKALIYLSLAYIFGVFVYGYFMFESQKQNLQRDIDHKLKAASGVSATILDDSYHSNIFKNKEAAKKRFDTSRQELNSLAKELGVKFIYSLVVKDKELLFASSSGSNDAESMGVATRFLEKYESAPKELRTIVDKNLTQSMFAEYSDKWGSFRSVFVPVHASDGTFYIIGADVEASEIAAVLKNSLIYAVKSSLFFLVLALPAMFFYIRDTKRAKKEILNYFAMDTLTGLPNRYALIKAIHDRKPHVLMLINIDAFKEINDFYGHELGDKLLYEAAQRLQKFVTKSGSKMTSGARLYRLHADEFAILFDNRLNREGLSFVAEVVLLHISSVPMEVDGHEITVNATVGIASSIEDDDELIIDEEPRDDRYFMTSANIALKQAKLLRRPYLFYDRSMQIEQQYEQNITWIKKLKNAIKDNNLVPFYQPIYNNKTSQVEKYESLVRLIDEKGFAVSPYHFLEIAKKSRLYDKITKTVIEKSFDMFKDKDCSFSVNLSILDIQNSEVVAFIFKKLEESDIGSRVVFEIVESEGVDSYDELYSFREHIKLFGSKISIDDFGAGYSNFDHILKLNPDFIKIDGSLIKNIDKDDSARILTKAIVGFAKELGSKTIAEFVHSKEVFDVVCALGIDYSQGYFISEPRPCLLHNS